MEVDLSRYLFDFKGRRIKEKDYDESGEETVSDVTVSKIMIDALLIVSDKNISGEEKLKRYRLALKIDKAAKAGGKIDLKSDEISFIKRLIGQMYAPIVVGQAEDILEGTNGLTE